MADTVTQAPPPAKPLQLWRCPRCGQPLARVYLTPGASVEIKCPKCGEFAQRTAPSVVVK